MTLTRTAARTWSVSRRRAAPHAEAREGAAAGLSVGERVVVCGLQSDTGRAMNGLQGVVGWIAEKQRWEGPPRWRRGAQDHQPQARECKAAAARPPRARAGRGGRGRGAARRARRARQWRTGGAEQRGECGAGARGAARV